MRILFVTNEGRGRYAGRRFEWLGLDFAFASFTFEDIVRFRSAPDREPTIDRRALDRAIDEVEGFDGVFAEEPETILLAYVRRRRGLGPKRWIANTVQRLRRAGSIRDLVRSRYGEDPLEIVAADPEVFWGYTTRAHRDPLLAAGLPESRMIYTPVSSAIHTRFFPDTARAFEQGTGARLPTGLEAIKGAVLLAGTNNRDLETLSQAAALLPGRIHVLTDLSRNRRVASPHLAYHNLVPLPTFIAAVAHAGVLVLPLLPTTDSCGQQTLAAAQRVGTVVVASDVPAIRDYIEDGRSGFLAPPGDPERLAASIGIALEHAASPDILAAARARDARDADRITELFTRVFLDDAACGSSSPGSG